MKSLIQKLEGGWTTVDILEDLEQALEGWKKAEGIIEKRRRREQGEQRRSEGGACEYR
jgi:hypothetical protein